MINEPDWQALLTAIREAPDEESARARMNEAAPSLATFQPAERQRRMAELMDAFLPPTPHVVASEVTPDEAWRELLVRAKVSTLETFPVLHGRLLAVVTQLAGCQRRRRA